MFSFIFQPFHDLLASPEQLGSPAGDSQGGGQPSCGGSRPHRCVPALLAGAQRATGVGGTLPPRLSPGGGNGKGGDSNSLLPQAISAALRPPPAGSSGPSLSSYPECSSIVGGTLQHRHSIRPQDLKPALLRFALPSSASLAIPKSGIGSASLPYAVCRPCPHGPAGRGPDFPCGLQSSVRPGFSSTRSL